MYATAVDLYHLVIIQKVLVLFFRVHTTRPVSLLAKLTNVQCKIVFLFSPVRISVDIYGVSYAGNKTRN